MSSFDDEIFLPSSLGQSHSVPVLELGKQDRDPVISSPSSIAFIGGFHPDEGISSEILIQFIQHLLREYGKDEKITKYFEVCNELFPVLPNNFFKVTYYYLIS